MISDELIALVLIVGIGISLLSLILVLPRRKASYEKMLTPIYEVRCSIKWTKKGGLFAGGNMPVARVSFYADFFVVAFIGITKIKYGEIKAISSKKGVLSSWIKVDISSGNTLYIYLRNIDPILKLMRGRM